MLNFLRFLLLVSCAFALEGATYYVDSAAGLDSNAGTSPDHPWKSLDKVNASEFLPGDRILFKSGSAWQGQLAPKSSGAEGSPIVINRYGEGKRPRIDGEGGVEDTVRLYNVQQIELRNLEITNQAKTPAIRRGVHVFLDNFGDARHIVLAGLYIHHISGDNRRKDNGGIVIRTSGARKPSRFDGLLIERNIIWKVDRSAIVAQSYHAMRTRWYPSLNVIVRDNLVDDVGGDGIVPWATDGAVIEHNIAHRTNQRGANYNAAIWPWSADNTVLQLNEACDTRSTRDGEGLDSDFNSRHTLFQYNYSHDNEGGFMLICAPGKRDEKNNAGNVGTLVRHNISHNDHNRLFNVSGYVTKTLVHDNAFYVGPGLNVDAVFVSMWNGWPDDLVFRNNRFYVEGTARYGHQLTWDEAEGLYEIDPGWEPARGVLFEGNRFYGTHTGRPSDPKAVVKQKVKPRVRDWNVPRFNPSNPDGFDEFLAAHRAWMLKLFETEFSKPVKLER